MMSNGSLLPTQTKNLRQIATLFVAMMVASIVSTGNSYAGTLPATAPSPVALEASSDTVLLSPISTFSLIGQADGANPDAPEGENAPSGAKKVQAGQSLWSWVYEALGLGYIIIFLGLSFVLVTFFIMNFISSRRSVICPQELAEDFERKLDENQFQEAFETAKADDTFLGTVLASGMARLEYGYEKSVEAMQEVGEDEAMKLEHRLSYLDLIARVSPMVGLFGTVHGMILAFQKIAESGSTPEPALLAKNIATALVTTLLGLAIAIPAMVAYTVLRNGVHRLILEVGMTAEELMVRFEQLKGNG